MAVTSTIEIKAAPKKVFDVVTDFEKYPEFMSDAKGVRILKREKNAVTAEFEIHVIKKIRYTLKFQLISSDSVSWSLVSGDIFKKNCGSWEFEEVKKGVTKATYTIDLEFSLLVPKMVTNMLTGKSLPKMLGQVKTRVESI